MIKNCFRIFSAGIALVLCIFALVSCGNGVTLDEVKADPLDAVENAYEEYADAIDGKYGDFFESFDEATSSVSSQKLTFSMKDVMDVELNLDVDAGDRYAAYVNLSTPEIEKANLKIWSDGDKLALNFPELLGEGNYGVNLTTFKDDIKESPMFNEEFTYEDFKEMLADSLGISSAGLGEDGKEQTKIAEFKRYLDDVKKTLEGITPEILEESIGSVNCISVQYDIPKDDVCDIVEGFIEAVRYELETAVPGVDVTDTSEYDEIEDVTVKFYIAKNSGAIYKTVLTSGESTVKMGYSADLDEPLNITLDVNSKGEELAATLNEKATLDKVDISFDVKTGKNGTVERTGGASFTLDVESKALDFKVIADGRVVFTANGSIEANEGKFELSLDKITVNGDDIGMKLSYSIMSGIPLDVDEVPAYKDITDMNEDDFSALLQEFMNSEIGSKFYEVSEEAHKVPA